MCGRTFKRIILWFFIFGIWAGASAVAFQYLPGTVDRKTELMKLWVSGVIGAVGVGLTGAAARGLWELSDHILTWIEKQDQ